MKLAPGLPLRPLCPLGLVWVLGTACVTPTETLPDTDQVFLFEVEYASSWFPTWTGVAIDRDGRVIRYRREDTPWVPTDETSIRGDELETKYESERSIVGRLDLDVVEGRFGQIRSVGADFSQPNLACADAGRLLYTAYRYDPVTARYRPVKLREEGDAPTQNRGGTAPALAAWLRSVLNDLDVQGVRPFEDFCVP